MQHYVFANLTLKKDVRETSNREPLAEVYSENVYLKISYNKSAIGIVKASEISQIALRKTVAFPANFSRLSMLLSIPAYRIT
jgi:hypothetical protein